MIDVYAIGTTLKLTDLLTPQLLKISREMTKLDGLALQVNKRLKVMGSEVVGVRNLTAGTQALGRNLKTIGDRALGVQKNMLALKQALPGGQFTFDAEMKSAAASAAMLGVELKGITAEVPGIKAASRAVEQMARHLGNASLKAGMLHSHMQSIVTTGSAMPAVPIIPRAAAGGGGRRGGGGGGRGGAHGPNMHIGPGGIGMGAMSMGLGPVGVAAVGGYMAFQGAEGLFDAARDYEMAFMRFKALNLGASINKEADEFAKASKHFGVSNTDMMKMLSESVGLFGSFKEAKQFAPKIAELSVANQAVFGDKVGTLDEAASMGLLKFIDRRGGFKDEKSFQHQLDLAEQMVTGSGGRIKFSDLDQFSQRGGTAFRSLSDEGLRRMAGLIIEQGGSAAGVAQMSMYQNLVAGRTPKKTMAFIQELGLGKLAMQEHGSIGGKPMKSLVMKDIVGADLLQSNPPEWWIRYGVPAIETYERAHKQPVSDQLTAKYMNDVLSNRTGSNQATIMSTQSLQLMRDYELNKNSLTAGQVTDMYEKSAVGSQQEFTAAWNNFKTEFGKNILPQITEMLKSGADLLHSLGDVVNSQNFKDLQKFGNSAINLFEWPYKLVFGKGNSPVAPDSAGPAPVAPTINPVADRSHAAVHLSGNLIVDGRKLGDFTADHIGREAHRLSRSMPGDFDPTMNLPPVSLNYR